MNANPALREAAECGSLCRRLAADRCPLTHEPPMTRALATLTIVALLLAGAAVPARAGAVGDAMVAFGGWVGQLEADLSSWIERVWGRISVPDGAAHSADAFRRLSVEAPERLDALAGRAGFALVDFAVPRDRDRALTLRFRFERELSTDERQALSRDVADRSLREVRPEIELLDILLDASDWRDAAPGIRFLLTGVEVVVDASVSSTFVCYASPTER